MSVHRLLLVAADGLEDSRTDFLWAVPGLPSSFDVSIGPAASELGPVPPPAVDLLRLAVLVYLVDRTVPRPAAGAGDRWERQLELVVPVCAPAGDWQLLGPVVGDLLRFLTGDRWTLGFEQGSTLPKLASPPRSDHVVSLLSGGADSFLGGLLAAVRADRPPLLVSHSDWSITAGAQKECIRGIERLTGVSPDHVQVRVGRRHQQIGGRVAFGEESTSRSRSFLFIAIAVAVAAARGACSAAIPENGFMSLNPPLAPERRGALSTRTTHPRLLEGMNEMLKIVGIDVEVVNPFIEKTKGEMFRWAVEHFGPRVGDLLATTRSCARTGFNFRGLPPGSQCGVCIACLVRRAAFIAAGLPDATEYVDVESADRLPAARRADLAAVRYAARRGFDAADLLSLRLPEGFPTTAARGILDRGLRELSMVPGL